MTGASPWWGSIGHGLAVVAAAAAACVLLVFLIRRLFRVSAELSRKLVHMSVIAALTAWLYGFDDWRAAVLVMAVFVIVVYPILLILEKQTVFRFLDRLVSERHAGEIRMSLCAVGFMFMLVTAVCWGYFGDRTLALASIYAWGPGDAAAALIGTRFGKTKIGREKKKSLEGTLAMFTLSFLCVFVILLAGDSLPPLPALAAALLTAAVSAQVELEERRGLDTLFCPMAAMTILCVMRLLF